MTRVLTPFPTHSLTACHACVWLASVRVIGYVEPLEEEAVEKGDTFEFVNEVRPSGTNYCWWR